MMKTVFAVLTLLAVVAPRPAVAQTDIRSAAPTVTKSRVPGGMSADTFPALDIPFDPAQHAFVTHPGPLAAANVPPPDRGLYGDVNADGMVNILDAQQIARHSAQLPVVNANRLADNGDVNDDGSVDIVDAQLTARYSIGLAVEGRVGSLVTAGIMFFPFDIGRRWFYDVESNSTTIFSGTCPCVFPSNYTGTVLLYGAEIFDWQGRTGLRVFRWDWLDFDDGDRSFRFSETILSVPGDNLDKWVSSASEWRRILPADGQGFSNNAFLLAGSNLEGAPAEVGIATVTVPLGVFDVVNMSIHFRDVGTPFSLADITEDRDEYYGTVGLALATWDYWYDDNTGGGTSVFTDGAYALRYMDQGPFPEVMNEQAGNDGPATAATTVIPAVTIATTALGDLGTVVDDPDVAPNKNGVKSIEDWWRLANWPGGSIDIELLGLGANNDLDLYLFEDTGTGITFIVSSTTPSANERLFGTLSPGDYFIGVQAWDTPTLDSNGDVLYFLSIQQ